MKLASVAINNYRGIESLELPLDPHLTVLFGENGCGKTTVLTATAMALGIGADGDYHRAALDRRVGATGDPWITLRGVESAAEEGQQARTQSLHVPKFRLPMDFDEESRATNRYRGDWEFDWGMNPLASRSYDIERTVVSSLMGREVGSKPDYEQLFEWFHAKEYEELRLQRERGEDVELDDLAAVRKAICRVLHGVSEPRVGMSDPPRLVVTKNDAGSETTFAFEQLSDGYRGVLALAADIARHMAEFRPERESADALDGDIIVLIDEIELHLHPAWQQRILTDLRRTFPNAQFVVSTHSPHVLTSVQPEHIVELAVEDGRVVAGHPPAPTFGAEAGNVLLSVMGVEKRPANAFSERLKDYMRLIGDDKGETEEAKELRRQLDELSYRDPGLHRADLEIRRRKMLRDMGEP